MRRAKPAENWGIISNLSSWSLVKDIENTQKSTSWEIWIDKIAGPMLRSF